MTTGRPVLVLQVPERLNLLQANQFLEEIRPLLQKDRPQVVLDFSEVRHLDSAGVEMLLRCLEIAMTQDGDLKLAAVPPRSAVILELTRVDRLFETFENTAEAVGSFQEFRASSLLQSTYAPHLGPINSKPGNGGVSMVG